MPRAFDRRRIALTAAAIGTIAAATAGVFVARATRADRRPTHLSIPLQAEEHPAADPATLRICADPNNLPFSNASGQGFENAIMALVATELGKRPTYYWEPQRRGFIRTTLKAGRCDVVPGIASNTDAARTTHPYYRSTYVFVSRLHSGPRLASFDDPELRHLRIGLQLTGDDYENPPAAQALARRGIVDNVRGFMVYGDYAEPEPMREVVDAVADGRVDVAVVWGPTAGFFAKRAAVPLRITPVLPRADGPSVPFVYNISMGVRRQDKELADAIDGVLARRATDIRHILESFSVPLVRDHD